jgi:hypothetical protein
LKKDNGNLQQQLTEQAEVKWSAYSIGLPGIAYQSDQVRGMEYIDLSFTAVSLMVNHAQRLSSYPCDVLQADVFTIAYKMYIKTLLT